MILYFAGTHAGMTPEQMNAFNKILKRFKPNKVILSDNNNVCYEAKALSDVFKIECEFNTVGMNKTNLAFLAIRSSRNKKEYPWNLVFLDTEGIPKIIVDQNGKEI